MSCYISFISKELILKSDTPKAVIDFIDNCVNHYNVYCEFGHKFFTLERWKYIFVPPYHLKEKTKFIYQNERWRLKIVTEINHGREEILEFTKWITPFIIGHKPKEFIGEYIGEERSDRQNVYLERN